MKRSWQKRLCVEDGVSILYGVLFMLVAVFVASLMLSAAVTAATRVDSEQERNQDTLALRSAGELVRECIAGSSFTVVYANDWTTGKPAVQWVSKVDGGPSKNLEDRLLGSLRTAAGAPGSSDPESGSFQVEVDSSDPGLPEGLIEGVVDVDYTIHVEEIVEGDIVHDRYIIDAKITLKDRGQRLFLTAYNDLEPNSEWTSQTLSWPDSNIELSTTKGAAS